MVSLVDIVPQTRTVPIAGGEIELRGLGLRQIAGLLVRFPELRKLFTPGGPEWDLEALLLLMPDAVGSIIAESARQPEAAATIPDTMSPSDIVECLAAIRMLTIPNGIDPLFQRLADGGDNRDGSQSGVARDISSPSRLNSLLPPDMLAAK
jgi:hypothetical protein